MVPDSEAFLDSLVDRSDQFLADALGLKQSFAFAKRQPFAQLISDAAYDFLSQVRLADSIARTAPIEGRSGAQRAFRAARLTLSKLRYYLDLAQKEGIARVEIDELSRSSNDLATLLMTAEICAKQGGIYFQAHAT